MTRRMAGAALLLVPLLGCGAPWETVRSASGGFSVQMPKPEAWKEVEETPYGRAEFYGWRGSDSGTTLTADWTFSLCNVAYADLRVPDSADPADVLSAMRDWLARGWPGKILGEHPISLVHARGTEYMIETSGQRGIIRVRLLLVGDRFFRLTIGQPRDGWQQRRLAKRFFDSFNLTSPAPTGGLRPTGAER